MLVAGWNAQDQAICWSVHMLMTNSCDWLTNWLSDNTVSRRIWWILHNNLTIRASLATSYTLCFDNIVTQGQKVNYTNQKNLITTRAGRKRPIGRFSSSCTNNHSLHLIYTVISIRKNVFCFSDFSQKKLSLSDFS